MTGPVAGDSTARQYGEGWQPRWRLPPDTAPVVGLAAITATALLAAPAIAAELTSGWGLSPSAIGLYFTVEQGGMCLATLPALWWLKQVPWRRAAAVAMALFILANLLSTQVTSLPWLLPLRALSALSGGSLMVLSMTLAGRSRQSERLFGLWVLGQLVVGAALLTLLPRLFALFGLAALYLLLAGLMTAASLLLRQLPATVAPDGPAAKGARTAPRLIAIGVGGILLYYIGYGGVWPFMAAIARTGGSDAIASGTVLAIGSLFGIAGAFLATLLAARKGQAVLVIGYALIGLSVALLLHEPSLLRFGAAACLLKGASTFTLPFILGRVAALDPGGRLMGLTNMAIGGGLAIGPLLAGGVIQHAGGLPAMISLTLFFLLGSTLLLLALAPSRAPQPGIGQSDTGQPRSQPEPRPSPESRPAKA
ncbi:hypothetical protein LWE61_08990 [Sphingobium sufflavum]|uniref:MFS transporter n=1 Tax=Sphingobium sufflavum TaxID=1129547 RepID=UPI001F44E483|nr:hypothetical protein [Sphingobium sufflavum]MCE7796695.1 hypothetical protein [Sphingobium sufflavum]